MSKTCPKCGADCNGKPAPKELRFWCASSAWEDGDFYQSPECVRRERDRLLDRIKRLEEAGDAMWKYCDSISALKWEKAKEPHA